MVFDDFDNNLCTISGLKSSNDTVIVLFQDENIPRENRKPIISFDFSLKCQENI